jgi:hypothetical protein
VKRAWSIVLTIVGIALAIAALCIAVGMITGAELERIYSVFERIFEVRYNINLDELINTWLPQVIETVSESI